MNCHATWLMNLRCSPWCGWNGGNGGNGSKGGSGRNGWKRLASTTSWIAWPRWDKAAFRSEPNHHLMVKERNVEYLLKYKNILSHRHWGHWCSLAGTYARAKKKINSKKPATFGLHPHLTWWRKVSSQVFEEIEEEYRSICQKNNLNIVWTKYIWLFDCLWAKLNKYFKK